MSVMGRPKKWESARVNGERTPEYAVWLAMRARCDKPDGPRSCYKGIGVCDRWRNSFDAFLADMGRRPTPQHSIDREDGSRGYEPGNCRWVTLDVQLANRRNMGRKPKLTAEQRCEALRRRAAGETLMAIALTYRVDISMISRLS